jgi:predicted phage terminase large subunit-like protein
MSEAIEIRPQRGPQETFLATAADISIYGGAAGGGNTWGLLLEPLRHIHNKDFGAVIFRRTYPMVTVEGGMWDESGKIYPHLGAASKETTLEWTFPEGARVRFAHMQHEKNRLDWQGSQIPLIEFDELTHFTEKQFFYMLSRNRSVCGVRPYIRASTNPEADTWVAEFIAWWIGENGYPIPERAGVLRWMVRIDDTIHWYPSSEAAQMAHPEIPPKSVTFIPARIQDNPALLQANPEYLANLLALPMVERERLLGGNWIIRLDGGMFKRPWFTIHKAEPHRNFWVQLVRYWDKAGTADGGAYTAGVLMGKDTDGRLWVLDVVRGQWAAAEREKTILQTAHLDLAKYGPMVEIWIEQEPGSGGKESAEATIRRLAGFKCYADRPTGDKVIRAEPFAAQAEAGNVHLVQAQWTPSYLGELTAFPQGTYADQVDASSGALHKIAFSRRIRVY